MTSFRSPPLVSYNSEVSAGVPQRCGNDGWASRCRGTTPFALGCRTAGDAHTQGQWQRIAWKHVLDNHAEINEQAKTLNQEGLLFNSEPKLTGCWSRRCKVRLATNALVRRDHTKHEKSELDAPIPFGTRRLRPPEPDERHLEALVGRNPLVAGRQQIGARAAPKLLAGEMARSHVDEGACGIPNGDPDRCSVVWDGRDTRGYG